MPRPSEECVHILLESRALPLSRSSGEPLVAQSVKSLRRLTYAVGTQQVNGLHHTISDFRRCFGFPIPRCKAAGQFITGFPDIL